MTKTDPKIQQMLTILPYRAVANFSGLRLDVS